MPPPCTQESGYLSLGEWAFLLGHAHRSAIGCGPGTMEQLRVREGFRLRMKEPRSSSENSSSSEDSQPSSLVVFLC